MRRHHCSHSKVRGKTQLSDPIDSNTLLVNKKSQSLGCLPLSLSVAGPLEQRFGLGSFREEPCDNLRLYQGHYFPRYTSCLLLSPFLKRL